MKRIGIVSWKVGDNSFGVTTPYLEWLNKFGKIRILDFADDFDPSIDLLVLPGGPDVDPRRYGEKPHRQTGKPCPYREYFDEYILPIYIENFTPIFGVCRGLQAISVHYHSKLNQHLVHETSVKNRWELVHDIVYKIKENNQITTYHTQVNSLHHQVVSTISPELKVIARHYKKDKKYEHVGVIEGIMHRTLPIVGLQYHPEELMYNELANMLVEDLLGNFNNEKYVEI